MRSYVVWKRLAPLRRQWVIERKTARFAQDNLAALAAARPEVPEGASSLAFQATRAEIIDGAKALSKAIRRTFGRDTAIQRCQIHKARNILERLPKSIHASVRRVLRQAWEMDDAERAETLIRNLARRLERDWNSVSASILEGIDEMLTVTRLGLPRELRRSLACTNIIENVMGTVRRVCRNVKYWRSPSMALRWAAAAMQEAVKGFRRLKAYKHLPALRAALAKQGQQPSSNEALVQIAEAA